MERMYRLPPDKRNPLFYDMSKQSHLLVAGSTGSGKSVAINGIIHTILHRAPGNLVGNAQFILIDPKRVELAAYAYLPHTLCHADGFSPEKWSKALNMAVDIMDRRYEEMKRQRIKEFNGGDLYVIIDEWANIYKNGGANCYRATLRLLSEGRAAHVHVILATQVPKANIIPTEIRENFTARLCLMTESATESRVVMGKNGCEDLPDPKVSGYALGYYKLSGKNNCTLRTIPYVKQKELDEIVEFWEAYNEKPKQPTGLLGRLAAWFDCGPTYDV